MAESRQKQICIVLFTYTCILNIAYHYIVVAILRWMFLPKNDYTLTHVFVIIMNIVTLLMSFMFSVYMAAIACLSIQVREILKIYSFPLNRFLKSLTWVAGADCRTNPPSPGAKSVCDVGLYINLCFFSVSILQQELWL